jgi:hypothetical protein
MIGGNQRRGLLRAADLRALEHIADQDVARRLSQMAVDLRRAGRGIRVRNVATGRVLPCHYGPCQNDGDDRIRVEQPHENPRWRNPVTGEQEMLVRIFCSEVCKRTWLSETLRRPF